jgi:S1-C subfamily serine protease
MAFSGARRRRPVTVLAGAGAAAMVVAGILVLMASGPLRGPGDAPDATATFTTSATEPVGAARDVRSLVDLVVGTGHLAVQGVGVAVAGSLVATTADAVDSGSVVHALTAGGGEVAATVVGLDRTADIAVLRVSDQLPVPRFEADTGVTAGRAAMVLALAAGAPGRPVTASWAAGSIASVGTAAVPVTGDGMAAVAARSPGAPAEPGAVLVDPSGAVIGIYGARAADGDLLFIPSDLVQSVSRKLAAGGPVDHGWLDVAAVDLPPAPAGFGVQGAVVSAVASGGAADAALRPGDVIMAVDGQPVRSMAELRARLYVEPPGASVTLRVLRQGAPASVVVHLAPSP